MQRYTTLASAPLPDGVLRLERRDDGLFRLAIGGRTLMASDQHGSEDALATLSLRGARNPEARVLIGGLGMGFTLRAALDAVAETAEVHVAELVPEVVAWCRGPLADLSGAALEDPRTRVHVGDVADLVRTTKVRFDAILLDVDNGPRWEVQKRNQVLYTAPGLEVLRRALRPGGVLAVWSADAVAADFERRLAKAGFVVTREAVRSRGAAGGSRHAIYLARLGGIGATKPTR